MRNYDSLEDYHSSGNFYSPGSHNSTRCIPKIYVQGSGRTPLSWAARNGHEMVVKVLVENGAEFESKDNGGQTPLSLAAENGHEAVVGLLLEKGAKAESTDKRDRTFLFFATK